MKDLPTLFDQLVTTEAAVRMESVHRQQRFKDNAGKEYSVENPDQGNTREEVANHLAEAFLKIYDFAFQDSSQHQKTVNGKVCNVDDLLELYPDSTKRLHEIFQEFVNANYNENGTLALPLSKGPTALKQLYKDLDSVQLHQSELARGALFVEMGRGDKWQKTFPQGIDFTRGEPVNGGDSEKALTQRFNDAFFAPDHKTDPGEYIKLPESIIEIAGVTFPVKRDVNGWQTHLITETGHLVNLTDDLKKEIGNYINERAKSKESFTEFKVNIYGAPHISQFEEGNSPAVGKFNVRQKIASRIKAMPRLDNIDGLPAKNENGEVRLMSMDVDFLTGLNHKAMFEGQKSDLDRFKAFMKKEIGIEKFADLVPETFFGTNIRALPNEAAREVKRKELSAHIKQEMEKLLARVEPGNTSMQYLVKTAARNLEAMIPRIYESADKQFIMDAKTDERRNIGAKLLKSPPKDKKPNMYMAMGGSASGKSGITRIAEEECGKSLVMASLDDARYECQRYWLYAATNNHNDDYKNTEQFGNAIRDLVTKRALAGGYNVFIDGSGIPYEGRNDVVTKRFKDKGYDVSVLGVQAPLCIYNPEARKALFQLGQTFDDAFYKMGKRLTQEMRGMIPELVADKHIGFALASRNAARDPNVDRFIIKEATAPKGGASYTLSYVLTLSKDEMKYLLPSHGAELKHKLEENKERFVPKGAYLPDNNKDLYDLKVVRQIDDNTYRVEIITNMEQYIGMVQKGLLKRGVHGPEALFDNSVHSDVKGDFMAPGGKLAITDPEGYMVVDWPKFKGMSTLQHARA